MKIRRPPLWLGAILCAAAIASGASLGTAVGSDPNDPSTSTLTTTDSTTATTVRTIRRVTQGKVITLESGVKVVHVPLLIIRTDHHFVRVPAHNLRIRRGASPQAAVAVIPPQVPVTVTVYLPVTAEPVTITETQTVHDLTTVTVPTTSTLPVETSAPAE